MLLELKHVTGKSKEFSLKDISFSLEEGILLGIAGKNGAGKTTLFRYFMEFNHQYYGEILLDNEEIQKDREKTLNKIGFISDENIFFKKYTIGQNAELLGNFYKKWDQKQFEEQIAFMGLSMGKFVGKLSRGEWIKFQIAFAAAHKPRLYLMDEPTAGMDPVFRKEFFRMLQRLFLQENISIIMTTHIQEEMDTKMDMKMILEQGRLISFGEAWYSVWRKK